MKMKMNKFFTLLLVILCSLLLVACKKQEQCKVCAARANSDTVDVTIKVSKDILLTYEGVVYSDTTVTVKVKRYERYFVTIRKMVELKPSEETRVIKILVFCYDYNGAEMCTVTADSYYVFYQDTTISLYATEYY